MPYLPTSAATNVATPTPRQLSCPGHTCYACCSLYHYTALCKRKTAQCHPKTHLKEVMETPEVPEALNEPGHLGATDADAKVIALVNPPAGSYATTAQAVASSTISPAALPQCLPVSMKISLPTYPLWVLPG